MSGVIDHRDQRIVRLFSSMERTVDGLENLIKNRRATLNGEIYLTDKEVSERLKISRRTLQEWRNEGKIAYIQLGGKIIYAESAIQSILERHYINVLD